MTAPAPLENSEELLFRQVHPNFIQDERPSSQAFKPTPKDEKQLSVAREALTNSADAFRLHTEEKRLGSVGTWAVSVGEAKSEGLPSLPDPLTEPVVDPAHALVDFSACSNSQINAKGSRLAAKARERGRLHP
jgi:hypothetical protein